MKEIISFSEEDTKKTAAEIAEKVAKMEGKTKIICLKGQLGAGKTVFVKGFTGKLGIDPCLVKSPTYTYLRKYEKDGIRIYHFDYYRLNNSDELVESEILELIDDKNNILLIEWPEKLEHVLPEDIIEISIEIEENTKNSRKIRINNQD